MSELICSLKGKSCEQKDVCGIPNTFLKGSVSSVTRQVTGGPAKTPHYALAVLIEELDTFRQSKSVNLAPDGDATDAIICPKELIKREWRGEPITETAEQIGATLADVIRTTITGLNAERAR